TGIDQANGTGFGAEHVSVDLAIVKETPGPGARSYTGLALKVGSVTPAGLPTDIGLTVKDLFVLLNTTTAADHKLLDWSHGAQVSTTALKNLDYQTPFAVGGSLTLNLQSFVLVSGTFTIAKSQVSNVALGNGELLASGTLLKFNVSGASLFAGVGGQLLAGV